MVYPRMLRIRQQFDCPKVNDVAQSVHQELQRLDLSRTISPGQTVAITAGSRGIANIAVIIKSIAEYIQTLGATPFVVPAMGSHGGGTAEGQREIIESYGITEEFVGAEIRSSMETTILANTPEGIPVHFDKNASQADHVIVCGRIKPHTGFVGEIESGLMKMMLIGLGKHRGASIYHRAIMNYSFGQIVRSVADIVLQHGKVVAGLGIVENAYDETGLIAAVAPDEFEVREKELLVKAKEWMPSLPFQEVDLLIVDEIGKNISGSGMDTNIIGRKYYNDQAAPDEFPKVKRIFVRDLTAETHGNACGIGMAEFCSERLVEKTNLQATYINSLTGGSPAAASIPMHFKTDQEVLDASLPTIGLTEAPDARIIRIKNTLDLGEVDVSETFLSEIGNRDDLTVIEEPANLTFDSNGNLPPLTMNGNGHG